MKGKQIIKCNNINKNFLWLEEFIQFCNWHFILTEDQQYNQAKILCSFTDILIWWKMSRVWSKENLKLHFISAWSWEKILPFSAKYYKFWLCQVLARHNRNIDALLMGIQPGVAILENSLEIISHTKNSFALMSQKLHSWVPNQSIDL